MEKRGLPTENPKAASQSALTREAAEWMAGGFSPKGIDSIDASDKAEGSESEQRLEFQGFQRLDAKIPKNLQPSWQSESH